MLAPIRTALLALALASPAAAQIIVNTGDDLVAVVAAAPDGSVIEIQSDAVFVGTLGWFGKDLTIQAGAGFTPTVKGDPSSYALHFTTNGSSGLTTLATFQGLTLLGGDTGSPSPYSAKLSAKADHSSWWSFIDCTMVDQFSVDSRESSSTRLDFLSSQCQDYLGCTARGDSACELNVFDSTLKAVVSSARDTSTLYTEVQRSRLRGWLAKSYNTAVSKHLFESSVFKAENGADTITAFVNDQSVMIRRLVNCTVSDFGLGLWGAGTLSAENMLFVDNNFDLGGDVDISQISNSLLEGGQFDGQNGNFMATPCLDANFALSSGSPGIDAGNSLASGLGVIDYGGDPRVQDGDADSLPQVNVGAVETVGNHPASATVANGNGVNQLLFSALTPPILGNVFKTKVGLVGSTRPFTFVGYDAPAAVPFTVPGYQGEFLLALTGALFIDSTPVAPGAHHLPLPFDCALIGASYRCQGVRLELSGPVLANALDLVFGLL